MSCIKCSVVESKKFFFVKELDGKICYSCYKRREREKYKDKIKAYKASYFQDNKEKIMEERKENRAADPSKYLGYHKNYREKNKEKVNNTKKEWYKNNKEAVANTRKKYYVDNKEKILAKKKERLRNHEPEEESVLTSTDTPPQLLDPNLFSNLDEV